MASIVQLAPGGTAQAPSGAITVKLSTAAQARVVLTRGDGEEIEPDFRKSPTEAVFVPREDVVVAARPLSGQPFPPGARVGVSLRSPSGAGAEIVRPAADVGGHHSVALARVGADGLVHDALADGRGGAGGEGLFAREWLREGSYAYHVNHQGQSRVVPWSLVLDASASILVEHRRAGLGRFLERLIGIVATAFSSEPKSLLVATDPLREAVSVLDADRVDWVEALGSEPAPWARMTHAAQAAGPGAVVVVLDGVPVDYRELTAWASAHDGEVLVVAVGRSRYAARPEDRPSQFWEEELAALDGLAALEHARVVSVTDLDEAAEATSAVADALFPVGRSRA